MDYSSISHDADHPAGSSPWGSSPISTPQSNSSNFGQSEPPMSPYSADRQAPANYEDNHDNVGSEGFQRPVSSGTVSTTDDGSNRPYTADSAQAAFEGSQSGFVGQQQPQQQEPQSQQSPQQQYGQQQDPRQYEHQPQRRVQSYNSGGQQTQRQSTTQYKLQAKITGLERTGRKDPILRFDVYVGGPLL